MSLKDRINDRLGIEMHDEAAADRPTGFPRRTLLKAGTAAVGTLSMVTPAAATNFTFKDLSGAARGAQDEDDDEGGEVDSPEGFSVEALASPATFPDDVAAEFRVTAEGHDEEVVTLDDASNVIVAEATFEPGGTSGWHQHPGLGIVNVAKGEIEIVHGDDCTTATYTAGEAFIDPPEHVHTATNTSDTESARVYVTFLGVPDDTPATVFVEPQDCPQDC